ncbi:MAG: hypothetical protein L0I24_13635 [Pseudonocardia sp.]|nr:hypothetical protein [Pseudonocardia sp.]
MSDELASRDALRELLFDDVAPPPGSEAMFAATFAATGSEGAELLPPDDLFDDPVPDDGTDELPLDDPAFDDPGVDPDTAEDLPVDSEHHHEYRSDPAADPTVDPTHHDDPGTGW